jgi:hypothetical protein
MTTKQVKITKVTDDKLDECIQSFLRHNKKFNEVYISRNKIIYELANYYLKVL